MTKDEALKEIDRLREYVVDCEEEWQPEDIVFGMRVVSDSTVYTVVNLSMFFSSGSYALMDNEFFVYHGSAGDREKLANHLNEQGYKKENK